MRTNPAMMLTVSTHHGKLVGAPCRITSPLAYNYIIARTSSADKNHRKEHHKIRQVRFYKDSTKATNNGKSTRNSAVGVIADRTAYDVLANYQTGFGWYARSDLTHPNSIYLIVTIERHRPKINL